MVHLFNKFVELGLLVSGMSTVWKDTDSFVKQYRYAIDIYLMTLLSYLYRIIMDNPINEPGNRNNVAYGLDTTDKIYSKKNMELLGKSASNDA